MRHLGFAVATLAFAAQSALAAGLQRDDRSPKPGGVYSLGFAAHDDNVTTLRHFVSFVKTLGIGASGKVDINAVKLP